jgi:hypothetical protein
VLPELCSHCFPRREIMEHILKNWPQTFPLPIHLTWPYVLVIIFKSLTAT